MVNNRVENRLKSMDTVMQSIASEAYKKTAKKAGEEGSGSFQREYVQALVRDYFYSGHQAESPKEKLIHLQKLKASIDSLQLPADFKITKSTEEISLGNFMSLLEKEMDSFEENKEEKLKEEKEKLKNLSQDEIENIVTKAKGKLTLGEIERLRNGEVKVAERNQLPPELIQQIKSHFEKQGIEAGVEHEQIAKNLLEKGIELSDTVCHNIDMLITAKNKEISQERIEELAKQYASIQKIDLMQWNKEYPLSAGQVEDLVNEIQNLDEHYQPKIGKNFKTIEEALDNYRSYKADVLTEKDVSSHELSKSQLSFQYIRYKMTLEKALTLNSRGIAIDKAELLTIEKELLRLEISGEQLEQVADVRAISQDDVLNEMLNVEHNLIQIMGADYGSIPQMMTNFTFKQISGMAMVNQASEAINRYDNLGTKVRSDLGDSMTKAFQRLNSLLLANGIEVTEDNLRAVEILGRGQVEINTYNVDRVKELDAKLQLVLRGLTPEAILQLWENGKDILAMNLDELVEFADTRESKDLRKLSDRVAKKINQMEKNGQVNSAEKEQLILVYRLLNAIEKSESGAMAALMKDNRQMSLENLYDMARYLRDQKRIDESIRPDTGLTEGQNWNDLKNQIRSGFLNKKREIREAFRAAEDSLLAETPEEAGQMARERVELLKTYSLRDWESLFKAWKDPTVQDAEIYKEFQKIPFLMSDSLRKLEKMVERNEKAKRKLEALKEVLNREDVDTSYQQVGDILQEIEADVIATETIEEKEILSALTETKRQWDYRQKLKTYHEFTQIPIWTGDQLHQINIYYPQDKQKMVKKQGEIRVLLAFEMTDNKKLSGFLKLSPDQGELILRTDGKESWVSQNKSAICQVFSDNQFPLTSLSLGNFVELSPYHDEIRGISEVQGEELLTEGERIQPPVGSIGELEQKMVMLAKGLAALLYR